MAGLDLQGILRNTIGLSSLGSADWPALLAAAPPYLLAFLLGILFSYAWASALTTHKKGLGRQLGAGTLASLASGVATAAFVTWKAPLSPGTGVAYVLGLLVSMPLAWQRNVHGICAPFWEMPPKQRSALKWTVRRRLFAEGPEAANASAEKFHQEYETDRHHTALSALHDFVHALRDKAAEFHNQRNQIFSDFFVNHHDAQRLQREVQSLYGDVLNYSLPHLCRVFEALVNRDRIWIAVRGITGELNRKVYRTLIRVNLPNNDRAQKTVDVPENSGLPSYLRDQYDLGNGVVIFGDTRPRAKWFPCPNDKRNQDRSLMVAPVFSKNETPAPMTMILCVNCFGKNAFRPEYADYVKCAVDSLSMFVSMAAATAPKVSDVTDESSSR